MKTFFLYLMLSFALFSCKKSKVLIPDKVSGPNAVQEVIDSSTTNDKPVKAKMPIEFGLIGDSTSSFEGEILLNQANNNKFTNRSWQGIPSIEVDQQGTIYIAWYTGGKGEEAGNYITVSVSKNQGKTWIQNNIIINPTKTSLRFFDPCLWKDKYGEICLSWSKSINNWDGKGGVFYSRIRSSDSLEYSKPRFLADGVMMNKPTLSYSKTTIFYPISAWSKTPGTFIYKSENDFLSFNLISTLDIPKNIRTVDEHEILQLADQSFICLIRGTDGVYYSKSENLTKWTVPAKFTAIGATNSGRFSLSRLQSGNIALVITNAMDRSNLKIFISDDECTTWKYSMLIDKRLGVSYPNLAQDGAGKIHVTYDYDRYKSLDINHVVFTESDVINNNEIAITRNLLH